MEKNRQMMNLGVDEAELLFIDFEHECAQAAHKPQEGAKTGERLTYHVHS